VAIVLCFIALGAIPPAFAEEADTETLAVVVEVVSPFDVPRWMAPAFEQHISSWLANSSRVELIDKKTVVRSCAPEDPPCALAAFRQAGIDVAVRGYLSENELRYTVHELWTPGLVSKGTIAIAGASSESLQKDIVRAIHPIVSVGGLIADKGALASASAAESPEVQRLWRHPRRWVVFFGLLGCFLMLPYVVALSLAPRDWRRLSASQSLKPTVALGIFLLALAMIFDTRPPQHDLRTGNPWVWGLYLIGAIAWSAVTLGTMRAVFPRLAGFDRVGHRDVIRLLRVWLVVAVQRTLLLALLCGPPLLLFLQIFAWLEIPNTATALVFLPMAVLFIRYWYACVVDVAALGLDRRLVMGEASRDNPWHDEIKGYVGGYLRRMGWDFDRRQLERILFLPGEGLRVCSYGGGLVHSRVIIPLRLLRVALGQPEEPEIPDHQFTWNDYTRGLVRPKKSERKKPQQTTSILMPMKAIGTAARHVIESAKSRKERRRRTSHGDASPRRALGFAPTLLGQITPAREGDLLPLVSDNPEDLLVVRELLAEHHPFPYPDPDEEPDDTDPTDRDFLFGVLCRELGAVVRGDDQLWTLGAPFAYIPRIQRVHGLIGRLYERWLSRYVAILGDAYAALNFARHHLVQYLEFLRTDRTGFMTARANRTELRDVSKVIFSTVADERGGRIGQSMRASPLNRLTWLSFFSRDAIRERRDFHVRNLAIAVMLGAVTAGVLAGVLRAVDYHPRYVEWRRKEQERISRSSSLAKSSNPTPIQKESDAKTR
jgi:hypothetical protein